MTTTLGVGRNENMKGRRFEVEVEGLHRVHAQGLCKEEKAVVKSLKMAEEGRKGVKKGKE